MRPAVEGASITRTSTQAESGAGAWPRGILLAGVLVAAGCSGDNPPSPPSPSSAPSPTSSSHSAPQSRSQWLTFGGDGARSGFAPGASFDDVRRAWTSESLDGDIYGEPLVVNSHVIAVTENNTVYDIDATTGQTIWKAHLGPPVPSSSLPCGNISPTSGITSTPVADRASGMIYVVAFLSPGHHEIFAISERTGDVAWNRVVDPQGMDPMTQQQRSALTLSNDHVYVSFGGLFGDCGSYHGWVAGIRTDGTGSLLDYQVPTQNGGGIWAPSGAATDGAGNLFVTTGNSFSDGTFDLGSSVIKLSPDLTKTGYFAPDNWEELNSGDVDLGSVGPAVLGDQLIFQGGKAGVGYLLDAGRLGGIGGQVYSRSVCAGVYGGTAHTSDRIFVPCTDGLFALTLDQSSRSFAAAWHSESFAAGPPIVAGGLVWTIDIDAGTLLGFDESSGTEMTRTELGTVSHFASPASAMGCVFAPGVRAITAVCTR
ncbi:MAG: PQQ-binding-like beta-propeller repeat protein [Nocardioidaceae bacterium]